MTAHPLRAGEFAQARETMRKRMQKRQRAIVTAPTFDERMRMVGNLKERLGRDARAISLNADTVRRIITMLESKA